jgi:hypothetical protein
VRLASERKAESHETSELQNLLSWMMLNSLSGYPFLMLWAPVENGRRLDPFESCGGYAKS